MTLTAIDPQDRTRAASSLINTNGGFEHPRISYAGTIQSLFQKHETARLDEELLWMTNALSMWIWNKMQANGPGGSGSRPQDLRMVVTHGFTPDEIYHGTLVLEEVTDEGSTSFTVEDGGDPPTYDGALSKLRDNMRRNAENQARIELGSS